MAFSDIFTTRAQDQARDHQVQGINAGYGQLAGLADQGRGELKTNYAAGLQPFQQNFSEATKGTTALDNALGLNGAEGNKSATAAFWNNPAIQSQLDIGSQNVMRNQAATGQLNSGKTNVDLQNLGQQVASQGWNNYVSSLQPYLNFSSGAASGIGNMYGQLGQGLNQSYQKQGDAAYGAQTSIGNANANADLSALGASANGIGAIQGGMKLASGLFGMFADGGRPDPGQPAIVGERGPEVFVPDFVPALREYLYGPRARGTALLTHKMGGSISGVPPRDPYAARVDQDLDMHRAQAISDAVPRGYADGGRPPADRPSIIGERGPEIFVPDRPGTVLPHHYARELFTMAAMRGGRQQQRDPGMRMAA